MLTRFLVLAVLFPILIDAQTSVPFRWEVMAGSSFTFISADPSYRDQSQAFNAVSEVRSSNQKLQPGIHLGVQLYKDDTKLSAVFSTFISQHRQQISYYRRSFTGGSTIEYLSPSTQWSTYWANVSLRLRYSLGMQERICLTGGISASHHILNQNLDAFTEVTTTTVFNAQTGQNQTVQSTRTVELAIPLQRINFGLSGGVEILLVESMTTPLKLGLLYMHGFSNVASNFYLKQQGLHLSLMVGLN